MRFPQDRPRGGGGGGGDGKGGGVISPYGCRSCMIYMIGGLHSYANADATSAAASAAVSRRFPLILAGHGEDPARAEGGREGLKKSLTCCQIL